MLRVLRNGENDVVCTGAKVIEYRYDSWGKLKSTTGTLATSLGQDNPFRYRAIITMRKRDFITCRAGITILRLVGLLMRTDMFLQGKAYLETICLHIVEITRLIVKTHQVSSGE